MFRNGFPQVYFKFLSNMVHLGLEQYVIPFPSTSRLAAGLLKHHNVQADLIHIDATHEYTDVLEDITLWWDILTPGGVLLGDDYLDNWPGVQHAVKEFATNHKLNFSVHSPKWYMSKPSLTATTLS